MYVLSSNITITDPETKNALSKLPVIECNIKQSRLTLTDTATLTLPRNIKAFKNSEEVNINDIIKRGAPITIQLGYNGSLVQRFAGVITKVNAQVPITIECQDAMFPLKQDNITKSWPNGTSISQIVGDIYTGSRSVVDLTIGGYNAVNQNAAQILDDLKKFGLQCYFEPGLSGKTVLHVDFPGVQYTGHKEVNYDFAVNILDNNLEYKRTDDFNVLVKATSTNDTGEVIKLIGDGVHPISNATADDTNRGGEVISLDYYNMDKTQLKKIINSEIAAIKYNGLRGSFTTWGLPVINHGDTAVLTDKVYSERNGNYLVESVEISFGVNGYRQEVNLERSLP